MSDAPSGKLKEQDLSNLDVTKLTPSSPEVISRQATINIGTIGHVAHGKSTIVKAVSGVQTVRFKNELERNITIKLDSKVDERQQSTSSDTIAVPTKLNVPVKRKHSSSSDFNSSKIKVVRCFDEKSLENVNAALCDAEKCIEKSSNQPQDATDKNYKISEKEANSNSEDSEISDNQNNIVRKKTCERNDETSDDSLPSLPISNVTNSGNKINNNNSNIDLHIDNDSEAEEREITDTAIIIIPTLVDENVDAGYKYIVANDHLKKFILNGQVMKQEDTADAYDPTEIDKIIDDEIVNDIHYYLVKWKNWSRGFNTWERFGALTKVQKMLFDYAVKKKKRTIKEINAIHLMLSRKTITELFELFKTESGLSLPLISYDDLSVLVTSVEIGAEKCRALRIKSLRHCLNIIGLGHYRAQQLYNLKQWEIGIIAVTGQNNITVENNTDFEGPPDSFVYTTKYIPRCGIIISDDPPIGCICKKNCASSAYCCNEMSGYSPVYDLKKISIAPGCPVYECNKKCKCSSTCPNRVVQLGSSVNVCIYKTNKYGWGVKANHDIQKGQFVANYVGEIITVQESEDRLISNSSRLDCMWNLDFEDPQNFKYIIDGTHYANFTHFINHSCNANLNVYAVWIDCLDPNIPQLALFASRDILAGEQLTTNYFSRCSNEVLKKSGSIRCQCNMKNCKGYYF